MIPLKHRLHLWAIERALRLSGARRLLVVPCGDGRPTGWYLPQLAAGRWVVGADLDRRHLRRARRYGVPLVACDVRRLPFREGSFDLVLSQRFLLHFPAAFRQEALREMARVSRRFVLVHFDTRYSLKWLSRRLRRLLRLWRPPDTSAWRHHPWKRLKRPQGALKVGRGWLRQEARRAGLRVRRVFWSAPLCSERWWCLLER